MSLICWNCHGLGNPCTEDQLAEMVRTKDPPVLFLVETWTNEAKLTNIQNIINWKNKFIVPRRNKEDGLVLFWKEDFDLEIESFSKNHIDTMINKNKEDEWRFMGLYGELETQKKT